MAFPAIRSLAMPCAGVILFLAGCAGMDGGKQKGQCGSECAANTPPAAAGHSEKSPEPTVRPVSNTTDSQPVPAAGPAVPPGGQNRPPEPERFPRPLRPRQHRAHRAVRQITSPLSVGGSSRARIHRWPMPTPESASPSPRPQAARVLWLLSEGDWPELRQSLAERCRAENGDVSDLSRSSLEAGLGTGAVAPTPEGGGRGGQLSRCRRRVSAADRRRGGRGRETRPTAAVNDLLLSVALAYRSPPARSSRRRLRKRPLGTPRSLPI